MEKLELDDFDHRITSYNVCYTKLLRNWELAGARAASVVRLLEENGVPGERMIATSYGEYNPVASIV